MTAILNVRRSEKLPKVSVGAAPAAVFRATVPPAPAFALAQRLNAHMDSLTYQQRLGALADLSEAVPLHHDPGLARYLGAALETRVEIGAATSSPSIGRAACKSDGRQEPSSSICKDPQPKAVGELSETASGCRFG
jgi:hypothetical protein